MAEKKELVERLRRILTNCVDQKCEAANCDACPLNYDVVMINTIEKINKIQCIESLEEMING